MSEPFPPSWADAWGDDPYGLWAELIINDVTQRLRYIPAGQFWMGSPEDEPESYADEHPRHLVQLTEGFWLADTACTQAFWRAVMSDNLRQLQNSSKNPIEGIGVHFQTMILIEPSQFKNAPNNPVERVSWQNVQTFLEKLRHITGLAVSLPTEAQWEYACRAGTNTPFWWGRELTTEQTNYNGKHPYNQGQLGAYRERTLPVKSFQANPWGLWQMHGNVWEWCQDGPRAYKAELAIDPIGPSSVDDFRALRGGSWIHSGGDVRSASRNHDPPDLRNVSIGFRWLLRSPGPGRAEPE